MRAVLLLLCLLVAVPCAAQPSHPGRWAWAGVLGGVAAYELWAVQTHHETMSQEVQHSKGLSIAVGIGLGAL
ncbi:MAG TPA: hypothetical protein VN903_25800, partial [Polyangia bacterium]|nr:hypothetical protein [Polyangia bacterium]